MSTKINTEVKKVISMFMAVYSLHKPKEVADKLGVTSQVLNNWISRNSPVALDKIREVVGEEMLSEILLMVSTSTQAQLEDRTNVTASGNGIAVSAINGHARVTTNQAPRTHSMDLEAEPKVDRITADVIEEMQKMTKREKVQILNACLEITEKQQLE